jgi:hypothetical protein
LDDNNYNHDSGRSFSHYSRHQNYESSGDEDDEYNDERSYYGSGDDDNDYADWEGSGDDEDDFEGSGDDSFDPWGDEDINATTEVVDIDIVDEEEESTTKAPDSISPTAGASRNSFGAYRAAVIFLLPQLACWLPTLFVL